MANSQAQLLAPGLALLFDMDGVVINSNPLHTAAWKSYLETRGIVVENIEQRMLGKHNDEIVRDFIAGELTPEQVAGHGAAKEALYREMMASGRESHLLPGICEFLAAHAATPKAVATNAEPKNVEFVLSSPCLQGQFKFRINGHQVKNPKPHPEIYLAAAKMLETDPKNCIVFEDSLTGIQAARAAGTRVVGVASNGHPLPGVDLVIQDFRDPQLEPWLRELQPR